MNDTIHIIELRDVKVGDQMRIHPSCDFAEVTGHQVRRNKVRFQFNFEMTNDDHIEGAANMAVEIMCRETPA